MSFATEVRNELARIIPEKSCCQRAELAAILTLRAELGKGEDNEPILITTVENASSARKIYRLLKETYGLASMVHVQQKKRFNKSRLYLVETGLDQAGAEALRQDWDWTGSGLKKQVNWNLISKNCCKRAYLRGIFISRGFINRPEGHYHPGGGQ